MDRILDADCLRHLMQTHTLTIDILDAAVQGSCICKGFTRKVGIRNHTEAECLAIILREFSYHVRSTDYRK